MENPTLRRVKYRNQVNTNINRMQECKDRNEQDQHPAPKLRVSAEKTTLEFVAELLCVWIFKKYWLSGGSYWNLVHIDKTKHYDLMTVVENAKNNILAYRSHLF